MTQNPNKYSVGKRSVVLAWLAFLLPVVVIVSVWAPELTHYYVRTKPVPVPAIGAARGAPASSLLDEIGEYRVLGAWRNVDAPEKVVADADRILLGTYLANGAEVTFRWPFDPTDLGRGSASWQLNFAAFLVPDRLLKAYALTGREIYFEKALEFVKGWQAYERTVWRPRGLFWNDHAVAQRIYVLVDFWRVYRSRKDFDENTAEQIFEMLQRCATLLAKPDYFTFATNHGVIQNLALMHVGIAVPQLPGAAEFLSIGRTRIQKQFGFFLSPEGPVLEHSASYHRFGLVLAGMFARYMYLSGQPLPEGWLLQYQKAAEFYALLRRPDGSLPLLGDTPGGDAADAPPVVAGSPADFSRPLRVQIDWKPDRSVAFYPLSGYSIWWNGLSAWPDESALSQLLVTWSHFPGHGHQRAQDLSVLFWGAGQTWWTNTGYWSYGHPARLAAESWEGGGAPHAQGEAARNKRSTSIKGVGQERDVRVLDLERKTEDGLRVRRQVVQASTRLWLVLDQTEDRGGRPVSATWTTFPNVSVEAGKTPGSFVFKSEHRPATLDVSFAGAEGASVVRRRGDTLPFAGWVFLDGRPLATDALVVTHGKNQDWSAMVWSLGVDGRREIIASPQIAWRDAENWEAIVGLASGDLKISRSGRALQVGDTRVDIRAAPDTAPARDAMRNAFLVLQDEYPKYADVPAYRARMVYALMIVLAIQGVAYFLVRRRFGRYARTLLLTAVPAWAIGAVWLHAIYFKI